MGVFSRHPSLVRLVFIAGLLVTSTSLMADRFSDITNTKHNLSSSGDINTGTTTSEICVFCHTPHGSNTAPGTPLWNRQLKDSGYTTYSSTTIDATDAPGGVLPQPDGASKLCLSCHDGTLAVASVLNAPDSGGANSDISGIVARFQNIEDVNTPQALTTDLRNDHPISVTYDASLVTNDGEMRALGTGVGQLSENSRVGAKQAGGTSYTLPLQTIDGNDKVQCTTCHDPHIGGVDTSAGTAGMGNWTSSNIKFLRTNRFQLDAPEGDATDSVQDGDIICLYCHAKGLNQDVTSWKISAHANSTVADEVYDSTLTPSPTAEREFPDNIQVWQASCLNCHDTHTNSGQKRLLRKNKADSAGNQENTCYQCHSLTKGNLDNALGDGSVPNIEDEFGKSIHMPITTGEQPASSELHDITNADFIEDADNHGININSRHAECTDCHNPHRVIRNSRFNQDNEFDSPVAANDAGTQTGYTVNSADDLRTHQTGLNATSTGHDDGREGNVASGVLRGAWGVDLAGTLTPTAKFPNTMSAGQFEVKSGDPGTDDLAKAEDDKHLTREYQLCFKCHSSYAVTGSFPSLGGGGGTSVDNTWAGTGSNTTYTNGMTQYTNVAAEFLSVSATNPPSAAGKDQGEKTNSGSACGGVNCTPTSTTQQTDTDNNNHRSWHPVVYPTGRDRDERNMGTGTINLKAPWTDNVGTQTMYCSDCHGGETSYIAGRGAERDQVQGPHGSDSKFLLKSNADPLWESDGANNGTRLDSSGNYGLCGNCHQPRDGDSGFNGQHRPDSGNMGGGSCMSCHIAVPHGWKNKAFLANLLCVGTEAVTPPTGSGECRDSGGYDGDNTYAPRSYEPYYNEARLRVEIWRYSGNWGAQSSCSSGKAMEDGCPKTN